MLNVEFLTVIPDHLNQFSPHKSLIKRKYCVSLIELYDQVMGVKVYQKGKGKPKQSDEERLGNVFVKDYQVNSEWWPFISQGIKRYQYEEKGEFIHYGKWLAEPREKKYFNSKKIVLREIVNPRIFATIIDYPSVVKNIAAVIVPKEEGYSLEFLLGLLNSKLMTYYIKEQTPKSSNKSYPSLTSKILKDLPINVSNKELIKEIEINVNMILNEQANVSNSLIHKADNYIDQLVYKLYGLTEEEIAIVERSFYDN